MLVKNLSKGIVNLCVCQELGAESFELRKRIVSCLVTGLLSIESRAADADSDADNKSKGLKKASLALSFSATARVPVNWVNSYDTC